MCYLSRLEITTMPDSILSTVSGTRPGTRATNGRRTPLSWFPISMKVRFSRRISLLVKKQSAIVPKRAAPFNPLYNSNEFPNRVFKSMFVSVVGGFIFEVMHRLEGKWSGESVVPSEVTPSWTPSDPQEVAAPSPVTSCELRFNPRGYWVEARNSVDRTGLVTVRTIRYKPIGNGKLRVEMSDGMYAECKVETVEVSPYLLMTTAVDIRTGKPLLVETVTITDNVSHVRTIQDFSAMGTVMDVFVINERRVVDASTTELEPYEEGLKPQSI